MVRLQHCLMVILVNNLVKKYSRLLLAFVFFIAGVANSAQTAPEANICRDTGVVFAFFNGVLTTKPQAEFAQQEFRRIHGDKSKQGDEIKYEVLYNYSNGFEDFVETFEQRLLEQENLLEGRFELFFEALQGGGSWWSKIVNTITSAASILKAFEDWYHAAVIRNLTTLLGSPPTISNYTEHRTRIDTWILEGKKILFVAHSQGNLFANAAYTYALTKAKSDSVKVVHIAPASPLLYGDHTLADLDLVINGLRPFGSVASITDSIPGYLFRPAGANGKDILGHGLLQIYINQSLPISTRVKSQINTALATLIAPPAQASAGFFTVTLTWNGSGDVDLHTLEPSGSHVYYRAKTGASGYLDVDNTSANGPEHYYASCDSSKLQAGNYKISIANYRKAEGRTAIVQVASWNEGVLDTKSVILGGETRDNPSYSMFNVVVAKNKETDKYSVSLSQN